MNESNSKVMTDHLRRGAYLYVRQSSLHQVRENQESTARQYALKHRAQALGWNSDQIVVIDEDLGISAAKNVDRNGFQRLVADVGLGRVGVVMGLEVSRLARNSTDWHRLLEICALSQTLILDEDGIYDPSHFNDRLLLGLKGTMSEAELHVLRARLIGGQLNKARRGELWMRPPIGFIYDPSQRLVLDPDEQIQRTIRLLFETFQKSGSALRVVREFSTHNFLFPRRISKGPRAREILFVPLEHSRVLNILHNPRYAGAYVYGRTRQPKIRMAGQMRYRKLPRSEWKVFLPNVCPRYISWEQFEANQAKLLENAHGYGHDRRRSPAREGAALLQGLVICGVCGNRMTVRYYVRNGHPVPDYICQSRGIQSAKPICQCIPGTGLDEAFGKVVLESVTPSSLEVALEVFEELKARKTEMDRLRRAQLERVRQEAELAQHQYMLVRPENRLVADNLEREWNQKLLALRKLQEEYSKPSPSEKLDTTMEEKQHVLALASDLPKVWNDPRTPMRERKRMLRLLIEDVTLIRTHVIQIQIRWKGGAMTSLEQPLPKTAAELRRTPTMVVELVRALATEQTDARIAQTLNARWLRSGTGKSFDSSVIKRIRFAYDIKSFAECLRLAGWLTLTEIAGQLKVHPSTAKRFAKERLLHAVCSNDKGELLFKLPTGPLPRPQQGKRFHNRRHEAHFATENTNEVQYAT